jgi:hypothetical protein
MSQPVEIRAVGCQSSIHASNGSAVTPAADSATGKAFSDIVHVRRGNCGMTHRLQGGPSAPVLAQARCKTTSIEGHIWRPVGGKDWPSDTTIRCGNRHAGRDHSESQDGGALRVAKAVSFRTKAEKKQSAGGRGGK